MRWRPVAATAAGVVAVIGLGAGKAAAESTDEPVDAPAETTTTTAPAPTEREQKLARAAELNTIAASIPQPEPKPAPPEQPPVAPLVEQPTTPDPVAAGVDGPASAPAGSSSSPTPGTSDVFSSPVQPEHVKSREEAAAAGPESAPADGGGAAEAPAAGPTDQTPDPGAPAPATQATAVKSSTTASKNNDAAVAPSVSSVNGPHAWLPADVERTVDQRLAAAWRETPVRGPPPGVASALGNDGRTTIYQVAIVDGPDGREVEISVSTVQKAEVNNAGVAHADASGPGSARATGDKATTSIYQTTVVVRRGTGTATVAQDARVDNLGYAMAVTAGSADSEAVGNASDTTVRQTAVVVVLGSGDAQVGQSARVTNSGSAIAASRTDHSQAAGNQAVTEVNQVAVVVVHDEDLAVNQTSNTDNIGMATATGGSATGNNATNRDEQVTVLN